jgi:hypothetical protein
MIPMGVRSAYLGRKTALCMALASVLVPAVMPGVVHAQTQAQGERESLEALRLTTLALIDLLVQNGTLTREKADALLAEAKRRANPAVAQAPKADGAADSAANASNGPKAEPPVVRVPYVPQVVRDQIRNEVREEVIARARIERWGVPNATAEWTDRIAIEGDVRIRSQNDRPASGNPAPEDLLAASLSGLTRMPDQAAVTSAGLPTGSTLDDRDRLRLRARLAINAKINDTVSAGLRLATGSAGDRVSTNQTLGQNFNRYTFLLDRAFIRVDPTDWASVTAGRMANPWFSTDMVFSDNLSFEGLAARFNLPRRAWRTFEPFFTAGYFPVREDVPLRTRRSIIGAQVGFQWEVSSDLRLKVGLAQYGFQGFEGRVDPDYDPVYGAGRSYGQYEYEVGLRQRGNTLFLTNNPLEGQTPDKNRWGLAARFRPLALTAAAEYSQFAPYVIGVSGELVRNQAYKRNEIIQRAGVYLDDARVFGVNTRIVVGAQEVRNAGDLQLSVAYRWLGSDAVPDAFVDSDLGGGGTNVRGFTAGVNYGLYRDTQLGVRYLSASTISSPTVQPQLRDRYSLDTLQVDLNVRF